MLNKLIFLIAGVSLGSLAVADNVQITITPTDDLSEVVALVSIDDSSLGFYSPGVEGIYLPDISAGTTYSSVVSFPNQFSLPITNYGILATYTTPGSPASIGATIAFDTNAGNALIASSELWPFSDTESFYLGTDPNVIGNYYNNADTWDTIFGFEQTGTYPTNPLAAPALGDPGVLVNFSSASNGGSVSFTATPAPAAALPFIGSLGLLRKRRRRSCR